jgi:hypothetical protein
MRVTAGGAGVKALTIRQPWAGLIVDGFKDVENRNAPTHFRGRLCVHAGLTPDLEPEVVRLMLGRSQSHLGAVIGTVEILDCVPDSESPWALPGMWHWLLGDALVLRNPFPFSGKQGFFDVPTRWLPIRHRD